MKTAQEMKTAVQARMKEIDALIYQEQLLSIECGRHNDVVNSLAASYRIAAYTVEYRDLIAQLNILKVDSYAFALDMEEEASYD